MDALGFPALIALIAIAIIFDALNGLHDAANSIATIVSTRVLRPQYAVAWAAFFNFIAFLFFGLTVAQTVGTGIVSADVVDAVVIFNEPTPREVIAALLPDILVKGADWPGNQIVGREEVEAAGGEVVSIPVVPGHSTTAILEKIRQGARAARAES